MLKNGYKLLANLNKNFRNNVWCGSNITLGCLVCLNKNYYNCSPFEPLHLSSLQSPYSVHPYLWQAILEFGLPQFCGYFFVDFVSTSLWRISHLILLVSLVHSDLRLLVVYYFYVSFNEYVSMNPIRFDWGMLHILV